MDNHLGFIEKCCDCVEKFEQIVKISFGPLGMDQLFVTEGGSILVLNSGYAALETSNHSHSGGVYNWLRRYIENFADKYGDGTSGFILFLGASLRKLSKLIVSRKEMIQLKEEIRLFRAKHLYIFEKMLVSTYGHETFERNKIGLIIQSSLNGQFVPTIEQEISNCIQAWIKVIPVEKIIKLMGSFKKDHGGLIIPLGDGNSKFAWTVLEKDTLLLSRPPLVDLKTRSSNVGNKTFENARVVVLFTQLLSIKQEENQQVEITSPEQLNHVVNFSNQLIEKHLRHIKYVLKCCVIVSTMELKDPVCDLCEQFGILAIQKVPKGEAMMLCELGGTTPIFDLRQLYTDTTTTTTALSSTFVCNQVFKFKKLGVLFKGVTQNNSNNTKNYYSQIILQAPSEGLANQYKQAIQRIVKLLYRIKVENDDTILPVGGAFEIKLFNYMDEYKNSVFPMLSQVIQHAVVSLLVELTIQHNSKQIKQRHSILAQLVTKRKQCIQFEKDIFYFIEDHNNDSHDKNNIQQFEPVCLKLGQLNYFLLLLEQILNIDNIINI